MFKRSNEERTKSSLAHAPLLYFCGRNTYTYLPPRSDPADDAADDAALDAGYSRVTVTVLAGDDRAAAAAVGEVDLERGRGRYRTPLLP